MRCTCLWSHLIVIYYIKRRQNCNCKNCIIFWKNLVLFQCIFTILQQNLFKNMGIWMVLQLFHHYTANNIIQNWKQKLSNFPFSLLWENISLRNNGCRRIRTCSLILHFFVKVQTNYSWTYRFHFLLDCFQIVFLYSYESEI